MGLAEWIFPRKCIGCGKDGKYICENCEVGMWEEEQICPNCCRNSRYGEPHIKCGGKIDGLVCHFAYEGMVKQAIIEAKYRYYYKELEEIMGKCQELWDRPEFSKWRDFLNEKPLIVPVPLHSEREKMRGFNQAEIIANLVASIWKLEVCNLLIRTKKTERQVGRGREERLKAMEGVFAINSSIKYQELGIKYVLLVDDVWTTGATMRECAKTIKKTFSNIKVWGWVIAR